MRHRPAVVLLRLRRWGAVVVWRRGVGGLAVVWMVVGGVVLVWLVGVFYPDDLHGAPAGEWFGPKSRTLLAM